MNVFVLSSAVAFLASLFMAVFVVLKGRRSPQQRTFIPIVLLAGTWCLFPLAASVARSPKEALFWTKCVYVTALFTGPAFLAFGLSLAGEKKKLLGVDLVSISYFAAVLFLPLLFSPLLIKEVVRFKPYFALLPGPLYPVFILFFASTCSYSFYRLFMVFWSLKGQRRNQIKYVFIAYFLAFLSAVIHFGSAYGLKEVIPHDLLIVACVALLAYVILKYRLLDIRVAALRTAVFFLVYVPILAFPFWLGNSFRDYWEGFWPVRWWIVPAGLEMFLAPLGLYVYLKIKKRAEDILLREERRYQELLILLSDEMLKILNLKKLLRLIVGIVVRQVKLAYGALYLFEEEAKLYRREVLKEEAETSLPETFEPGDPLVAYLKLVKTSVVFDELKRLVEEGRASYLATVTRRLARLKAGVAAPIFSKKNLLGFLVLGPKVSEEMFTQEDLKTFDTLTHQLAIAIQNARLHRKQVDIETLEGITQLYSSIGHEFGNALHIVSLGLGILKAQVEGGLLPKEELQKALNQIEENTVRGVTITQDGKAYQLKSELKDLQSFSPNELVQKAAGVIQERFQKHPAIRLCLDVPENLASIQGHATLPLLFQALLSSSYWSVVQDEKGEVRLSLKEDKERKVLEITLSDTGFSLLSRLEGPHKAQGGRFFPIRAPHGGLYFFLIKKIVQEHGGSLKILDNPQSQTPDRGSVFLIRLPLHYTPLKPEEEGEGIFGASMVP
ncbi:MAG: GAF domain-containing protein [Candidatus Omnitrophica bacterium]|nr:GAF domain-containing protein [Candidatus Omnitrophota bacterium]